MSAPRKVAAVAGWFPASSPDGFLFVGPVMLPSIVQASHVMWGSEGSERVFDTVRELVDHCLAEHQIREYEPLRAELHCRDDFCPDVSDLAEHLLEGFLNEEKDSSVIVGWWIENVTSEHWFEGEGSLDERAYTAGEHLAGELDKRKAAILADFAKEPESDHVWSKWKATLEPYCSRFLKTFTSLFESTVFRPFGRRGGITVWVTRAGGDDPSALDRHRVSLQTSIERAHAERVWEFERGYGYAGPQVFAVRVGDRDERHIAFTREGALDSARRQHPEQAAQIAHAERTPAGVVLWVDGVGRAARLWATETPLGLFECSSVAPATLKGG